MARSMARPTRRLLEWAWSFVRDRARRSRLGDLSGAGVPAELAPARRLHCDYRSRRRQVGHGLILAPLVAGLVRPPQFVQLGEVDGPRIRTRRVAGAGPSARGHGSPMFCARVGDG
jgi:hypothetical protein